MAGTAFLDHFSGLSDPRQPWKVAFHTDPPKG